MKIGKLQIFIHPFFWVFAALLGFIMGGSLIGTLYWIIIILVSVLFHELGHALMAIVFKQKPVIQLVALGGVTTYQGKNLNHFKQFLIVLNGPFFGFLIYLFAAFLLKLNFFKNPNLLLLISLFQIANLFWAVVNLLPILPLDGGQLLRIALEGFFGVRGFKFSLLVGAIFSSIIAIVSFLYRQYLIGAIFFLFAFQSLENFRRTKNMSKDDQNTSLTDELKRAEMFFNSQNFEESKKLLEDIINKTKKGLIFVEATHVLSFIYFEKKEFKKAYDLLIAIKDKLRNEGIVVLHKSAYEIEDFNIVVKLSAEAYKLVPTQLIALYNARAFAAINKPKPAGGWLKTAIDFNNLNIEGILNEKYFEKVKNSNEFLKFLR
ncbi:MAG: hypothetical protein A3F40_04240 [Chlamydiae bacterium RIFCSPHIGHO2_12_FULL_27_8]|nr:MAG: hypothetical protein A3F40_04240 [Chlamydiae bacterium RIFCSPHIGHO2_12_FULL_27_8]